MTRDYVANFDREFLSDESSRSFFDKWRLLIELTTTVHMLEIRGLQAFVLAMAPPHI